MPGPRPPATVGSTMLRRIVTSMAIALAAAGCGPDGSAERPFSPTLATVDFRPKLVLVIGGAAVRAEPGERADPAVRTDPAAVPSGAVVEVRNDAPDQRRLRGGTAFDTGIMHPGERTTVVVTNTGPEPVELPLVDGDRPRGRLLVEPAPPS